MFILRSRRRLLSSSIPCYGNSRNMCHPTISFFGDFLRSDLLWKLWWILFCTHSHMRAMCTRTEGWGIQSGRLVKCSTEYFDCESFFCNQKCVDMTRKVQLKETRENWHFESSRFFLFNFLVPSKISRGKERERRKAHRMKSHFALCRQR